MNKGKLHKHTVANKVVGGASVKQVNHCSLALRIFIYCVRSQSQSEVLVLTVLAIKFQSFLGPSDVRELHRDICQHVNSMDDAFTVKPYMIIWFYQMKTTQHE